MKKKISKILALLLALVIIASIPMNSFAAYPQYANNSTVKIKCNQTKTYGFNVSNSIGVNFYGDVQIQKGGALSPDKVRVFLAPNNCDAVRGSNAKCTVKITIKTTDGKQKTETTTKGVVSCFTTPWVKGTLWKALSSVTVVITQTGVPDGNLKITLKT
ncbi:MAG: hypothetical protein IKN72_04485 [Clostridia bacterium]|nr:hypothetical protein [Clostridia bacterium]